MLRTASTPDKPEITSVTSPKGGDKNMNIKTVLVILASGFAIAYVAMSIRFTQAPVHSISRQFSTDTLYHQARAKLAKLNQDASAAWRKKNQIGRAHV